MRRIHRSGSKFGHHGSGPFRGAIWMIGIGVMMLWGHWWPGILILIGISLVAGVFWSAKNTQELSGMEQPPLQEVEPPSPLQMHVEFDRVPPTPQPVNASPRMDLLPANCPRCGAPVRSPDVRWRGKNFAACAYCGSNMFTGKH